MSCPFGFEPVHPRPDPHTRNFVLRLIRGLHSWLALLNAWDFQIPIGGIRFFGFHLFLVNQPAAVRQLMVEQVEQFPKHPFMLWVLQPLIGRGVFSVNGTEWERQRRLVDQAFQVAQLKRVFPQMEGATTALITRLDPLADGRSVEIDGEMTLVAADVIVRTILSRPLAATEAATIFEDFTRFQRRAGQVLRLLLLRLPQALLNHYLATHAKRIRAWIRLAIEARLASAAAGRPADSQDLLQALLEARDPLTGSSFSLDELVDQVSTLFLAGHETSAIALSMAVYLLAQVPESQERFRKEVTAVLGGQGGPLGFEALRQMPYGTALFNETLRLYPPIIYFTRESLQETSLLDQRCPMGSLMTISPWVIQRHEQHWSAPNCFRPERFLAEEASEEERHLAKDAFLPFGLGPRKCPGAAFALQEALLVLAELVRRYEILPDLDHTPDLVARLTLRSVNGVRVKLRRL